ncbi:hypothetical protein NE237_013936 [Protea cynaroides]|uniref:Protein RALF-like 32 n=1 Tax=Protea cynaroides TaxID=273540 RepID=A0A9Q0K0M2_9MAGN|nr:hypothetical protein NE237_013936 [Protea cynaroides]
MGTSWCRYLHLLFPLLLIVLPAVIFSATFTDDAYLRCNGSIAECNEEEELLIESEIARRFLQESKNHISYGALNPDRPVCDGSASGEPYSKTGSCRQPPSNPQNRGCSKIYRCRNDS